jgi:hypothetical protein
MEIIKIQDNIRKLNYSFSDHAIKRMIQRSIDRIELEEAVLDGKIIEEYPHDKYSPSCLICGKTKSGRILHVQVSLPPRIIIVTLYEPDPEEWIDFIVRR